MPVVRTCIATITVLVGLILVTPVLLLGLPFWAVSFLTRSLFPLCQPTIIRWPQMFRYDPTLGWTTKANLNCHCLEDRDDVFHVMTDEYGWPKTASLADSELVVFGDSYAFGYGVDHKSAFFRLNPNLPIKSIGVPGYNLVQEFLLMKQLSPQLSGKLIVWFIYLGNDLYDNLSPEMSGYRTPFLRQSNGRSNWEIVTSHLSPAKWSCSLGRMRQNHNSVTAQLHSPSSLLSQRAYLACEYLLEQATALMHRLGSKLLVMTIPIPIAVDQTQLTRLASHNAAWQSFDPDYPDRKIRDICTKLQIPFVPLRSHLTIRDYNHQDDHWNETGHQRVAQLLWDFYRHNAPDLTPHENGAHGVPVDLPERSLIDGRDEGRR